MAILAPDPEPVVASPPIVERGPTSEEPTALLGRPVSMYKNAFSTEPKEVALGNVLVAIRDGRWGHRVRALRDRWMVGSADDRRWWHLGRAAACRAAPALTAAGFRE